MKLLNTVRCFATVLFLTAIGFAQSPGTKLSDFDKAVRSSRVEMRKYCALVQQLMKENDEAKKYEAVVHITNSIELWNEVRKYKENVPEEYSGEKKFDEKLNQLYAKLEEMKSKLVESKFKESFDACGAACGLFVKIHEDNNLDYALDKLFHLRKAVKKLQNDLTANDESIIENDIKSILQKRNDVISVDTKLNPGLADSKEYQSYLMKISSIIDDAAFSYFNQKEMQLNEKLDELVTVINKAYSLAL